MLALTEAGIAAIIGATCSGIAAILAGIAANRAIGANRHSAESRDRARENSARIREVQNEVSSVNGRTLAENLAHLEAAFTEHLAIIAPHMRTLGSIDEAEELIRWIKRKRQEEEEEE